MIWTLLFLAYSSDTVVSEFGHGWSASWSILLVVLPVVLAGLPNILNGRRNAVVILVTYILYTVTPAILQLSKPPGFASMRAEVTDLVTVLFIWLPLEFKLLSRQLSPTGKVTAWSLLTAALNIVNTFVILRPLSKVEHARSLGYTFKLTPYDFITSLLFGLICVVVVVPVALAMGFGKLHRHPTLQQKPDREFAVFLGLYMSAVIEELLFRGLIHNMIEQRAPTNSPVPLILSSLAFAAAHISKSKFGFTAPNVRFAICSLVSGLIYGIVWQLTSKVTASAVTHAIAEFIMYRILLIEPIRS